MCGGTKSSSEPPWITVVDNTLDTRWDVNMPQVTVHKANDATWKEKLQWRGWPASTAPWSSSSSVFPFCNVLFWSDQYNVCSLSRGVRIRRTPYIQRQQLLLVSSPCIITPCPYPRRLFRPFRLHFVFISRSARSHIFCEIHHRRL